jgi:pimeloyl-ACP methyl ester carboxylesterase
MVALLVLAGMAGFATSAAADGAHGQQAPRMHFGDRVKLTTVCFSVTNPAGGQSTLYGLRYIKQGARVDPRTPAIVLVHGIASSTENWDFSPTWSVARAFAAAGYVVYSYDRLGYAKSSYFNQPNSAQPTGGNTLTAAAHRAELHQVVDEVGSGSTRRPTVAIARLPNGRAGSQAPGWSSSVTAPAAGSSLAIPGPTTTSPR